MIIKRIVEKKIWFYNSLKTLGVSLAAILVAVVIFNLLDTPKTLKSQIMGADTVQTESSPIPTQEEPTPTPTPSPVLIQNKKVTAPVTQSTQPVTPQPTPTPQKTTTQYVIPSPLPKVVTIQCVTNTGTYPILGNSNEEAQKSCDNLKAIANTPPPPPPPASTTQSPSQNSIQDCLNKLAALGALDSSDAQRCYTTPQTVMSP